MNGLYLVKTQTIYQLQFHQRPFVGCHTPLFTHFPHCLSLYNSCVIELKNAKRIIFKKCELKTVTLH